jgi:signal transduction histidine kinase
MRNWKHVLPALLFALTAIDQVEGQNTSLNTSGISRLDQLWNQAINNPNSSADSDFLLAQPGMVMAQGNFPKGEASSINTNATLYNQLGNYSKALEYYLKTLQILEKNHFPDLSGSLNNIGLVYANLKDTIRARSYYYRALQFAEKSPDKQLKGIVLMNLGELFAKTNRLDSALIFSQNGLEILLENKAIHTIPYALRNLGDVYAKLHYPVKALDFYRRSLIFARKYDSQPRQTETYQSLARFYLQEKQLDSCVFYGRKALDQSQALASSQGILAAATVLSNVYESVDVRQALQYYKLAVATKDSMFNQETSERILSINEDEKTRLQEIAAARRESINAVRQYVMLGGLAVFLFIALVLLRNNRRQQKANELLRQQKIETDAQKEKAENAFQELKEAQDQLVQQEKMASLGELTAGIAHEIQNPLNFVNNFSEVSSELLDEMEIEFNEGRMEDGFSIASDIKQNLAKITFHGKRADSIVKGMLYHSRTTTGQKELTDLNLLVEEYLRLSYHGLRAKDRVFNSNFQMDLDPSIGKIKAIPQDLGRVMLNLFNNAFYAVSEKEHLLSDAHHFKNRQTYEPLVTLSTKKYADRIEIKVWDNGLGIPAPIINKIFQPFFTTKPAQQGTGLGLSLSYEIITTGHSGEIKVNTLEGEFAEFTVVLPLS